MMRVGRRQPARIQVFGCQILPVAVRHGRRLHPGDMCPVTPGGGASELGSRAYWD